MTTNINIHNVTEVKIAQDKSTYKSVGGELFYTTDLSIITADGNHTTITLFSNHMLKIPHIERN